MRKSCEKETTLLRSLPPQAQGKTYGGRVRHRTFLPKLGIAPPKIQRGKLRRSDGALAPGQKRSL
ncbi:MAG: hypothetical protein ACYTX0_37945 [Nostoc sp.]